MALITRFSRLFTADLNAVLDRIEEPEILLKQAVRDMEEELADMQASVRTLRSDAERLGQQERADRERLEELDGELEVCFRSGEDELARGIVRRKLETERRAKIVSGRRSAALQGAEDLAATIAEDQRHLEHMRQKLEVLVEARPAPVAERGYPDYAVGADEVEVAFLREKQRRTQS